MRSSQMAHLAFRLDAARAHMQSKREMRSGVNMSTPPLPAVGGNERKRERERDEGGIGKRNESV